jgi:hypothetical protein
MKMNETAYPAYEFIQKDFVNGRDRICRPLGGLSKLEHFSINIMQALIDKGLYSTSGQLQEQYSQIAVNTALTLLREIELAEREYNESQAAEETT